MLTEGEFTARWYGEVGPQGGKANVEVRDSAGVLHAQEIVDLSATGRLSQVPVWHADGFDDRLLHTITITKADEDSDRSIVVDFFR